MNVDHLDDLGSLAVPCDPTLFGAEETVLRCRLWREEEDQQDPGAALDFIREHFRQSYDRVLAGTFAAYRQFPLWDVWMGDGREPVRLDFAAKEELHPYIGRASIDLALWDGEKFLWALAFGGTENRLSIEHGLCAVFEGERLEALVDHTDFPSIVQWWEWYKADNILTGIPSV